MKKFLERSLMLAAMVVGLSIGVLAQKDGTKKPPPKDPPPVVTPQPKPPKDQPGEGKKPKKPAVIFLKTEEE